jgi:hypothetical protein
MVHRIDCIDLFSLYVPVFSWMALCRYIREGMASRCAGSGCEGGQGGWLAGRGGGVYIGGLQAEGGAVVVVERGGPYVWCCGGIFSGLSG